MHANSTMTPEERTKAQAIAKATLFPTEFMQGVELGFVLGKLSLINEWLAENQSHGYVSKNVGDQERIASELQTAVEQSGKEGSGGGGDRSGQDKAGH